MIVTAAKAWPAVLALASIMLAQTPEAVSREVGEITAVDASAKTLTIRTDAGTDALVRYDDRTSFRRIAAGEKDVKNASTIAPAELVAGDRVVARGVAGEDGKSLSARSVIVMAKADVARKQAADRAAWDRRGMGGVVTAVNPQANEITVKALAPGESQTITISLAEGARVRRYAPESVKFSDAKPGKLDEIQAGDQVKALGTKSADGLRFVAEELVSGSFLNIAATVDSIDADGNVITVTDLATKKKVAVRLTADSAIRRLPPFAANMLANSGSGRRTGIAGPAGPPPSPRGRREGVNYPLPPSGAGGPGGTMRERPRDLQSMLERIPAISVTELKAGDAVMIASTRGANPSRMTAINILAGVEPLLRAPQGGRQSSIGSWNLDLNMNMSLP
ncbi:MAG TPA: hypothetical protein VN428_07270 [Bryobacteraceae bacterium]|nr:hypothetical protein [Bryobacteraceae bacterium]